jgi:hypothetical protein
MLRQGFVFILLSFIFLAGCQKASVDLKAMSSVSGFSLDQSSVVAKQVSNPNFSVSGRCNKNLPTVQVSFDGGTTWLDLATVSTASLQCSSTGSFSAAFNRDLTSFVTLSVISKVGGVYFRGNGSLGVSNQVLLPFRMSGGLKTEVVASAKYETTVDGYRVRSGILSGATNSYQNSPAGAPGYVVKNLRVEAVK